MNNHHTFLPPALAAVAATCLGIPGALPCLFLLSTGDDKHLPVVKKHYQKFIDNPKSIGDHTWNNGYNGIVCAEYYLRTGEKDMLPVLQAFCDDARDRQKFGCGWIHWGTGVNPPNGTTSLRWKPYRSGQA